MGVGLEVVGWYQISGQPTEGQQLPYLASATIPGAALIVAGVVLVTGRRVVEGMARGKAFGSSTDASGGAGTASPRPGLWALPDGSYLHRADCPLLDGKPEAYEIETAVNAPEPPTRPCPICEPGPVGAP